MRRKIGERQFIFLRFCRHICGLASPGVTTDQSVMVAFGGISYEHRPGAQARRAYLARIRPTMSAGRTFSRFHPALHRAGRRHAP